jgi:hypothetical protein
MILGEKYLVFYLESIKLSTNFNMKLELNLICKTSQLCITLKLYKYFVLLKINNYES